MALAVAAGCGGGQDEVDLLLTAERVFDGERLLLDAGVAVDGDRIVAVGHVDELDVEPRRRRDFGDATIVPGLVDMHVHALGAGQVGSAATTVRDLGAPDEALPAPREVRGRPRVLAAGPLITAPRGYPFGFHDDRVGRAVRTAAEARRYVRSLARRRAATVKVSLQFGYPVLTFPVVRALVQEAHAAGLRVSAHVFEPRGARLALRAGVDDLAHMPCSATDEPDADLMRDLAAAGVEIVGTFHVHETIGRCASLREHARLFVAAGGTLLYGSDFGNHGIPRGVDVLELELMHGAGLTRLDVLRNATSVAGALTGVPGVGRLRDGAPADVVVVEGDLRAGFEPLRRPLLLLVRGFVVPPATG